MRQNKLSPAQNSKTNPKRIGRGNGSGHGTYSGRGCKGQKSRSGYRMKPGFEGGQLPLIKRLPRKRGFYNIFRKKYSIINLNTLKIFDSGSEITPEKLMENGIVKSLRYPIKVLARGEISYPVIIKAHKFSAAAKVKITAVGGSVEDL